MHNWRLVLGKSSKIHVFFSGKGISLWNNLRLSGCRIETALQTSTVDFYSHLGWGWEVSQLIFFGDAYLMSLTVVDTHLNGERDDCS